MILAAVGKSAIYVRLDLTSWLGNRIPFDHGNFEDLGILLTTKYTGPVSALGGPNYSTDGYEWQTIITAASDTTYKFSITSQSWNSDEEYPHFKYRIYENGNQENQYRITHTMWKGN